MPRTAAHDAWSAARDRLVTEHPQRYAALLDEERVARGLKPHGLRRDAMIAVLEARLARLKEAKP